MSIDEQKTMDKFQKLDTPRLDGDPLMDAHDFFDRYHEIFPIWLLESNGVDFINF